MSEQREIAVVERLTEVLDALGIPYAIGGSIASSLYGTVRFTRDADIALYPFPSVADRFCEMLKDEFYISEEVMQQALNCCGSFSIVHFETAFKIDIFLLGPSEAYRVRCGIFSYRLELLNAVLACGYSSVVEVFSLKLQLLDTLFVLS